MTDFTPTRQLAWWPLGATLAALIIGATLAAMTGHLFLQGTPVPGWRGVIPVVAAGAFAFASALLSFRLWYRLSEAPVEGKHRAITRAAGRGQALAFGLGCALATNILRAEADLARIQTAGWLYTLCLSWLFWVPVSLVMARWMARVMDDTFFPR